MSEQAVKSLEVALKARVRHFDRLSTEKLLESAIALIDESAIDVDGDERIPQVLTRVAALGALDAVAMLVTMNCSQEQVASALRAFAERSEDVKEGFLVGGLVSLFEEWAEEEIAAGRMLKIICPDTGKTLYSTIGGKR